MNRIVADGESRLRQSPEFQAQVLALRQAIEARYAGEIASASFARRLLIRYRISRELDREIRRIAPSPEALY